MTDKKAQTDPTFPAPPAGELPAAKPASDRAAATPPGEPIDQLLDDLGKPAPDRAYQPPKAPPGRAPHETQPSDNVIVREPTQPGLGNELNVTPEERERLDAMMKAHANAAESDPVAADRQAETGPGHVRNRPPPVTTEPGLRETKKSGLPLIVAVLAVALVLILVILKVSAKPATSSTSAASATVTAPPPPATTAEIPNIPAPPAATSAEEAPTASAASVQRVAPASPAHTGRPAHPASTAPGASTAHGAATHAPPPPGMNLLPDNPTK